MAVTDVPVALHRGEDDLPFVDLGDGSQLQLLQCDVLDEAGNVTAVIDAALIRDVYLGACEGQGLGRPSVIGA